MSGPAISFPPVPKNRRRAVAELLARYRTVCEVGVGGRHEVAAALAGRDRSVTATDVHARDVPAGVRFVRDDVVEASRRDDPGEQYRADAIYALNLPPELHRPTLAVARRVDADCLFTTLGGDPPAVDARPITLEDGETLYVARERGADTRDREPADPRGSGGPRDPESERT